MKMQSCTENQFHRIMYAAGGKQTRSEVGRTHSTTYWERYSTRLGVELDVVIGIKRTVLGDTTYEVAAFLYEAYIK